MKWLSLIELRVVAAGLMLAAVFLCFGEGQAATLCLSGALLSVVSLRTYSILSQNILSGRSTSFVLIVVALKLIGVLVVLANLRSSGMIEQIGFIAGLFSFIPGILVPGGKFRVS